nr:MAG TPA: hypothetical protein [Caudoviricetes sp.]
MVYRSSRKIHNYVLYWKHINCVFLLTAIVL